MIKWVRFIGFLAVITFYQSASASTICSVVVTSCNDGSSGTGGTGTEQPSGTTYPYNIFVDGDLYLDYSVLSDSEIINITGTTILTAGSLFFYSYDSVAPLPDFGITTVLSNPEPEMNLLGSYLMFSDVPLLNVSLEVTGNMYIANYSALQPVPLPAGIWLFGSGLLGLIGFARRNRN